MARTSHYESTKIARKKYLRNNLKQIRFALNINTDDDILKHLDTIDNKAGYLKDLIRADMAKDDEVLTGTWLPPGMPEPIDGGYTIIVKDNCDDE